MYQEGLGVDRDWKKAEYYYKQAEQELFLLPLCEYLIGNLYEKGENHFPMDLGEAAKHYIESARFGYKEAMNKLDELGVPAPEPYSVFD